MPIRKRKISYTLNLEKELEEANVSKGKRAKATKEAGEVARQSILSDTNSLRSSVHRGKYKTKLSKKYRDAKAALGKGKRANLRLDQKMLSNLRVSSTKKDFTIKITDPMEKKKASGHNRGDYNGGVKRQFLPDDSKRQRFRDEIKARILKVIEKYKGDPSE
tara:strand:- start:259 stop:744 length:486 start_codon:yes stop_codon:yes gene_type:complete